MPSILVTPLIVNTNFNSDFLYQSPVLADSVLKFETVKGDKVATSTGTYEEYSIDYHVIFAQITKIIGICTLNVITGMSSAGQQGDMPPSSSAPRRRGAYKLKRVQEATEPLVVDSNTYGQPCNDVECALARFIGLLIRDPNLVDINVKDWRKVPNDRKEMLYDTICDGTGILSGPDGPLVTSITSQSSELFPVPSAATVSTSLGSYSSSLCKIRRSFRDTHFGKPMSCRFFEVMKLQATVSGLRDGKE
ncbi:hypothetical protein HHK36_020391 [Tetracentron sinense]|uniref:Uncharacterized protein n=1 Tax=Tetracentron sinense TaxID=13715 RepID=A0A834YRL7_TETSI|nr:hypothetical protein HHK36_020391 [Tetracentron sinense]